MTYPLPQDFYDTKLSRAISASATEIYVDEVPTVTSGLLTIFDATDNKTPVEKIYYTGVDSVNKKLTGVTRNVYTTPQSGEVLFTSQGATDGRSQGSRIAMTDNINYVGLILAVLNGDMVTGGVMQYPNTRVINNARHLVDKEYADAIATAGITSFLVTDNGGITVNIGSGYYNWNGTVDFYAGASNQTLTDNAVNYIEFKDATLSINTSAFSNDAVPLAKVTTASGDITVLEDARAFITVLDIRPNTSAYLTCLTAGSSTPATWAAVTDGEFAVTIDGTDYDITAIDFTGDTTMNDVAATIQARVRAVTSGSETVVWDTDHFVITSGITGTTSQISLLGTVSGGTGTDISGASWLNGTGGAVEPGTWAGLNRDSGGLYIDPGLDIKIVDGLIDVVSFQEPTASAIPKSNAEGNLNSWVNLEQNILERTAYETLATSDLLKIINDSGTAKVRKIEGLNSLATKGVGTTTADEVRVCKIDDDKIVLGWNVSGTFEAAVATISAGVATFGSTATVSGSLSGTTMHLDMCEVDTDKFCMVASNDGQTPDSEMVIATVSGTTITFGTTTGITGNAGAFKRDVTVCKLDTNKVLVAAFLNTPSVMMRVGVISGTGVTFTTSGSVAATQAEMVLVQTGTDKAVMVYEDSSNNDVYVRAYTVSGTAVTSGSATLVEAGTFDVVTGYSIAEDRIVIAYGSTAATGITLKTYTVSGTTLTLVDTWTYDDATNNLGGVCLAGDDIDRVYLVANYDQKITMWGFAVDPTSMEFSEQFKRLLDGNHVMNHGQAVMYNAQKFMFGWLESSNYAYMTGCPDWYDFFGIPSSAITAGDAGNVYIDNYADGLSSLVINMPYYIGNDGALTVNRREEVNGETVDNVEIGRSISATELILRKV